MRRALLFMFCLTPLLVAQAQRQHMQDRNYDPSSVVTVKGTVEEVKQIAAADVPGMMMGRKGMQGMMGVGVHLALKTDQATFDVHLGPQSFLEKNKWTFAKGDQIEVTGSKIKFEEADAIIAGEVKKDGKTLVLRDASGVPKWSGRRRS